MNSLSHSPPAYQSLLFICYSEGKQCCLFKKINELEKKRLVKRENALLFATLILLATKYYARTCAKCFISMISLCPVGRGGPGNGYCYGIRAEGTEDPS